MNLNTYIFPSWFHSVLSKASCQVRPNCSRIQKICGLAALLYVGGRFGVGSAVGLGGATVLGSSALMLYAGAFAFKVFKNTAQVASKLVQLKNSNWIDQDTQNILKNVKGLTQEILDLITVDHNPSNGIQLLNRNGALNAQSLKKLLEKTTKHMVESLEVLEGANILNQANVAALTDHVEFSSLCEILSSLNSKTFNQDLFNALLKRSNVPALATFMKENIKEIKEFHNIEELLTQLYALQDANLLHQEKIVQIIGHPDFDSLCEILSSFDPQTFNQDMLKTLMKRSSIPALATFIKENIEEIKQQKDGEKLFRQLYALQDANLLHQENLDKLMKCEHSDDIYHLLSVLNANVWADGNFVRLLDHQNSKTICEQLSSLKEPKKLTSQQFKGLIEHPDSEHLLKTFILLNSLQLEPACLDRFIEHKASSLLCKGEVFEKLHGAGLLNTQNMTQMMSVGRSQLNEKFVQKLHGLYKSEKLTQITFLFILRPQQSDL